MTRGAIIASHGQPSDPDPAETTLAAFAAEVGRTLPGWQVTGATLAKPGALDSALHRSGPHPLIYPLFMTTGWFTGDELRKRLSDRQADLLPPFGLDPGLAELAAELLRRDPAFHRRPWIGAQPQFGARHAGLCRSTWRENSLCGNPRGVCGRTALSGRYGV